MEILLADTCPETSKRRLSELGHTCHEASALTADALPDALAGIDALVVRSTTVTAVALEAADRLALVVRAGAGVNNIDIDAASRLGIYVSNVPGRNAIAVAELTIGLLLAVDRRIADNVADLRAGTWAKSDYSRADGLHGKTIGVLGFGNIGLEVAERAAAFGLRVLAVDRPRPTDMARSLDLLGVELVPDQLTLAREADVLTVHVPGSPASTGLVGRELLDALGPEGILLNTSRGGVVDEDALLQALDAGLRAGLDVYDDEPETGAGHFDSPLARHPNVVGTHHIGASTAQAQRAVADGMVEVLDAFAHGAVLNCVNLETGQLGSATLRVRHFDRVGVLASVLAVLRGAELSVKQMENKVFLGSTAAVAVIRVAGDLTAEVVADLEALDSVIAARVLADAPS